MLIASFPARSTCTEKSNRRFWNLWAQSTKETNQLGQHKTPTLPCALTSPSKEGIILWLDSPSSLFNFQPFIYQCNPARKSGCSTWRLSSLKPTRIVCPSTLKSITKPHTNLSEASTNPSLLLRTGKAQCSARKNKILRSSSSNFWWKTPAHKRSDPSVRWSYHCFCFTLIFFVVENRFNFKNIILSKISQQRVQIFLIINYISLPYIEPFIETCFLFLFLIAFIPKALS